MSFDGSVQSIFSIDAVLRQVYQAVKWARRGPNWDSFRIPVSATREPTTYGSMFDAGLRSSM